MATEVVAPVPGVADPFPGLRPFEPTEEAIFRGRQQHTAELLRRLANHRFLAVIGSSGSGKSSLVRAGLLPALHRGYLVGATSRWRIGVMRPGMAPIQNLADALGQVDVLGSADIAQLEGSSLGLVEAVRAAKLQVGESVLLIADQFEELFRYQRRTLMVDGGAAAAHFVRLLLTAARRPDAPVYVVLTMRSDFLGDCAQFPGLPEALSESQYLIPRLTRDERRQAIEEPLRLFGASMTPQLAEQLLNDSAAESDDASEQSQYAGSVPDPLPVLQHALMRTYSYWKSLARDRAGARMDLQHYREAGRMESALDQHGEAIFDRSLDDKGRYWAERIFRCITTTELGRPVRRPTPLAELFAVVGATEGERGEVDKVLDTCRQRENSFIQLTHQSVVDISHESLIWKWKRLAEWIRQESASADLYRDLVKDAATNTTWGEPKLSYTIARREKDAWNAAWGRQYSTSDFHPAIALLQRSRKLLRNQLWLKRATVAAVIMLAVISIWAYRKSVELASVTNVRDQLADQLEKRNAEQLALADRIAALDQKAAGAAMTASERDSIAKQRADLEAQLKQSQDDGARLSAEVKRVTTLESSITALQAALTQAQKDVSAESALRRDTEGRLSQLRQISEAKQLELEQRIGTLTKDLERSRAPRGVEAGSAIVTAYRQLASDDPFRYRPLLADALSVSGSLYAGTQRVKDAEGAFTESLALQRQLAQGAPATYLPAVATTLHSLGLLRRDTNQLQEAETALLEALKIRRQFVVNSSATYQLDVAQTLNVLGTVRRAQGRSLEGIAAYEEGIKIRRQLAADNPAAARPGLASSLMNVAILYRAANRYKEAEIAYTESISLLRNLVTSMPESHLPSLALALNNVSNLYAQTDRPAEHEKALLESLSIYRQLAKMRSTAELPNMSLTLANLGDLYKQTKRLPEARVAFEESIAIRRDLVKTNPNGYGDRLAGALISLAETLEDNDTDRSRGCTLATEAAQVAISEASKNSANAVKQKMCGGKPSNSTLRDD